MLPGFTFGARGLGSAGYVPPSPPPPPPPPPPPAGTWPFGAATFLAGPPRGFAYLRPPGPGARAVPLAASPLSGPSASPGATPPGRAAPVLLRQG